MRPVLEAFIVNIFYFLSFLNLPEESHLLWILLGIVGVSLLKAQVSQVSRELVQVFIRESLEHIIRLQGPDPRLVGLH